MRTRRLLVLAHRRLDWPGVRAIVIDRTDAPASISDAGRVMRRAGVDGRSRYDGHARTGSRCRSVHSARRSASARSLAGFLPRRRHAEAVQRLRHQDRSLVAGHELERKVSGGRQRRVQRYRFPIPRWRPRSARGYATGGTDTGHAGGGASWALGHPEKVIDFGWRAVHEMSATSKQIIAALLRRGSAILVLERLFCRRPSGDEGSAALPGGLRRHHRRRARRSIGPARAGQALRVAKKLEKADAARLSAGETSTPARGRRRGVRRRRRCEGRPDRESPALHVRSGHPAVQGLRRRRVSDARAGRDGTVDLCGAS